MVGVATRVLPQPLRMITLNVSRTVERETDFALPQTGDKQDGDSDIAKDLVV